MKREDINIRDPFVLEEDGTYYLYGTRAKDFGRKTGGFDVYTSRDLVSWSQPHMCMDSNAWGLNREVNWAPEVHRYQGQYFMFATFTQENGLRGTYILSGETPLGPFIPYSHGAVTPHAWECLDGTLYLSKDGTPYLVFCHEHTQIIDGTICYLPLTKDLSAPAGEAVTLFCGSSLPRADCKGQNGHFITDGPFLYRTGTGKLLMIWSTFIDGRYAQCIARSESGEIWGPYHHLPPLIVDDGGHGMLFSTTQALMLALHQPNQTNLEHPVFLPLTDTGDMLILGNH